jgi:carbamoyl-phosphate synthase large subunit
VGGAGPAGATADEILALAPAGVVLSNGPGDPATLPVAVGVCRALLGRLPLFGICLGHQVLGQAIGATTSRLSFGHHGGNHPVQETDTGRVVITSQNHEFQVDAASIPEDSGCVISHRNLHDGSVEGLSLPARLALSVQFHPEGAPGPQDSAPLFDRFLAQCRDARRPTRLTTPPADRVLPPRRVLVIGSGPIIIGQAAEFDYAGTQACKALREEGVHTILVNSNPATIMTEPGIADEVYIEPLTLPALRAIIARARPDALLPTMGGQTALNLAVALAESGVLDQFQVRVLGTPIAAIRRAEDRAAFKQMLLELTEPVPSSTVATSLEEARAFAAQVGLPLVVRPAFTLGGTGGGLVHTPLELDAVVTYGLSQSPIHQVLVEESVAGWKEIEYEVMRDAAGTCITVCNMENIDPMGVHTGDSVVVAPSQTLSDRDYQMLRTAALKIIRALGLEGGCNVQFALAPDASRYYVIEVNPRVSRSSALASKATGYPIARIAAKIAVGRRLDELKNPVTGRTCAAFEPALDYCVVKIPRWPFDKFPHADRSLTTQMKSTGEVMAIGRTFEAALMKAVRSLEQAVPPAAALRSRPELLAAPNDQRLFAIFQALRDQVSPADIAAQTGIDLWFLRRMDGLIALERELAGQPLDAALLRRAKTAGLSDATIAHAAGCEEAGIAELRRSLGIAPAYKLVDTCAAEFAAATPYYYSAYDEADESQGGPGVVVLGSGPIRIGQGIEFDYCSVQAALALREAGTPSILINSNPETVSTDFDTSDRLYFEPLDRESVEGVLRVERAQGIVAQFGGQTAINLAGPLAAGGAVILGSSAETIDLAEDRRRCANLLAELGARQPEGATARTMEEALAAARRIDYPLIVRPSYVLGGRAMEVVYDRDQLVRYVSDALAAQGRGTLWVDRYLLGTELEVDALCDGEQVLIPGILQHVERAGVHSGDSMAVYPAPLAPQVEAEVIELTRRIALALKVRGLLNIQYVLHQSEVYVLEVNPRASRTVPFLSKATGVPMVALATLIHLGGRLATMGFAGGLYPARPLVAVKAPVFSMAKLAAVDAVLGPEMKSTGEVMGIARDLPSALHKAFLASLPGWSAQGAVLCSIADADKLEAEPTLRALHRHGYRLLATAGTAAALRAAGLPVLEVAKIGAGHPDVLEVIRQGGVQLVINTLSGGAALGSVLRDGHEIRRAAVERGIPCLTSLDTAAALVTALTRPEADLQAAPLPEYLQAPSMVPA